MMEEIQKLVTEAATHLSSGKVKDAYFSYISALDLASKELQRIKFINNVVASKPSSIASVFNVSRTCLTFAEDIIVKHQPPSTLRKNQNLNISIHLPTPSQDEHFLDQIHLKAPPIPPKPARKSATKFEESQISPIKESPISLPLTKPPLPPKPTRTGSLKKSLRDVEILGIGMGALLERNEKIHINKDKAVEVEGIEVEDDADGDEADTSDDDEEDDDEYLGSSNGDSYRRKSDETLNVSLPTPILRRRSSSPNISIIPTRRKPTLPGFLTDSPTDEEGPYPSHNKTASLGAPFFGTISSFFERRSSSNRPNMIHVVPEGAVDPNNVVAANIFKEMDNSPNSPFLTSYSDHVPEIPVSPLLTQHSQLEQKIRSLEAKLQEYRTLLRVKLNPASDSGNMKTPYLDLSEEQIKEAIKEYGNLLATSKEAITRNRNLVFKATDPEILEFAPHIIAYQLTLIEFAIFLEIDPQSLLVHSPKNPDPKITASTDLFNYLTRVVEYSVLLPLEASGRALVIHYWVKVAVKLHELRNYQTLKAVLAALGTPPIKRLKRTWVCIPKKSMARLEVLNEIMSETRNYGKYRETIQQEGFYRKPTIPFLGTFIMDATYLLAAVKSSGLTISSNVPNPSELNSLVTSISSQSNQQAQDDIRVQDLLQTMKRYQDGPKYQAKPPISYIKASTKHHFRTASISAALYRSGNKYHHRNEVHETIDEQQQLITHYLLTRIWLPEKKVDELSLLREPPKQKSSGSNSQRNSGGRNSGGTLNGMSLISNSSSIFRESTGSTVGGSGTSTGGSASTSSGMGRTSSISGSGESRPNSIGDGLESISVSHVTKLEKATPISEKESGSGKEKEKRNITEKVGNFLFRPRTSLDRSRDEKEKPKYEEVEKENVEKPEHSRDTESTVTYAEVLSGNNPPSSKRTSWRTGAMRVMFGGSEPTELSKTPVPIGKISNIASGNEDPLKSPSAMFNKSPARNTSSISTISKAFPYSSYASRRSMEEPRSATPPPLLPKPAALLQRSASASSASSRSSNTSITNTYAVTTSLVSNNNSLNVVTDLSDDVIEEMHIAIARKVANEVVAAGGASVERSRQ
ncbi:hypothetical protein G9A89_011241 [Geosiphon pyriformis]|nr:hypothetical protein G9A89_011241 [Geosiphon pyriformis]